ncbi:MAG: 16S rRNA (adenine(1518)-N(6)/adenine(1519)-N(6))-dimethyltransferase [Rhodobacteraceae bacterium]|jgi:16S rRNA (adenine1518-N6/adenine1519-N6)-dimethyltransferase|nr:16S rRNA (adenine(1518)-N(6)/adenine(1519)-N(6))-dimethyltransferase [Paracoccaceae bacterium]|tara:strand:+ start:52 stop:885 length:834 start_codon:yes stop_codon:yes gene_type:complete
MEKLPPLKDVISKHKLSAKKSLGQNFLLDLNLTSKIARYAGNLEQSDVLEIGPGPGGLTRSLLNEGARKVVAIEKDTRCIAALEEVQTRFTGKLKIVEGDALSTEVRQYLTHPVQIIANLPYNIGTELLVRWLNSTTWPSFWQSMTLMFQKEVANRIVASPGSKAYGRLSVMAQWRCNTKIAFNIPATAFTPPPKVESSIVHFEALKEPRFPAEVNKLEFVVSKAFNQRRKMLRGALKGHFKNVEEGLLAIGVVPTKRAENVTIQEFCLMAQILVRT